MENNNPQVCTRCVLNATFPGITFDENGICSVCQSYEKNNKKAEQQIADLPAKRKILDQLCQDAKDKKRNFDVLIPLSGGKDSMYVLYLAVKELGLTPLAFTMDNGYLTQVARDNIDRACRILGVEHVYYCMDPKMMKELFGLFIKETGYFCSICMRAIGMSTELVAEMYDIPLVFGGSASKVELPVAPIMFQSGPVAFISNVFKGKTGVDKYKRLLFEGTLKRRIGYRRFWWGSQRRLGSYAWVNLPNYIDWNYATMFKTIQDELGWKSPSGKEEEHIDCAIHKASAYIHDRRWKGSEIKRLNFAGLIMAGQMTREEALEKLKTEGLPQYDETDLQPFINDIDLTKNEFDKYIDMGPRYMTYRPEPGMFYRLASKGKKRLFSIIGLRKV
jgi:hypothetical protein